MKNVYTCFNCQVQFLCKSSKQKLPIQYCPFCRERIDPSKAPTIAVEGSTHLHISNTKKTVSFLSEHLPSPETIQFTIGPYQIIKSLGKGGMGEVFLAYDTICGRQLAIKQIRPDLLKHRQLHHRFLKEAYVTSQLAHPAIIPIYAIHSAPDLTYYTMPYINGKTLKEIIRNARQMEKYGQKIDHLMESIPALIRIFLSICQAVAYAHSKHIIHRDLKPENFMIGQYGQVVILDWGLAKKVRPSKTISIGKIPDEAHEESPEAVDYQLNNLTRIGKIVGTLLYMAPEIAMGQAPDFQTDIYSLGVILYQLLTLKPPFYRESLKHFRKICQNEVFVEPIEAAPYRDIPQTLSCVVIKCLSRNQEQRYQSVDELIHDLENYIEGRSEWFKISELDIYNKVDWEFQENVLIAEHIVLTHGTTVTDWVSLMISKNSFQENIKLEAQVKIGDHGHGIGFLLSIPESGERKNLNDGYCLWLSAKKTKSTKLLRSTVEVMHMPDVILLPNEWYHVLIEKIDHNIYLYLNNVLQFSYISHLPLTGTHVGLLTRDDDFELKDFFVYIGSQNITVNCLAVPDAFLAHKDYTIALNEYRRIGYSFPGRAEGREALFRSGITLLEQANNTQDPGQKEALYNLAHDEFHKLYNTPGAPLEYLGKALIYQTLGDYEEESKCLELAFRRYPHHPLLPVLYEKIIYRMHESSHYNRQAVFNFILLALRYLPPALITNNILKILSSLEKHWEPLPFIVHDPLVTKMTELTNIIFCIKLAFWLARPYTLCELIINLLEKPELPLNTLSNAIFCLIELGSHDQAKDNLNKITKECHKRKIVEFDEMDHLINILITAQTSSLESAVETYLNTSFTPSSQQERILFYLMESSLDVRKSGLVHKLYDHVQFHQMPHETKIQADAFEIWAYLQESNIEYSDNLLQTYPIEFLSDNSTPLYFLYGCWLAMSEGKEIASIHFSGWIEVPYPRTCTLFSYFYSGKITDNSSWFLRSFLWERRQLYRQVSLFYHCTDEEQKSLEYQQKADESTCCI